MTDYRFEHLPPPPAGRHLKWLREHGLMSAQYFREVCDIVVASLEAIEKGESEEDAIATGHIISYSLPELRELCAQHLRVLHEQWALQEWAEDDEEDEEVKS